jgi:cobalt-zinc-cadmium efflux system protein
MELAAKSGTGRVASVARRVTQSTYLNLRHGRATSTLKACSRIHTLDRVHVHVGRGDGPGPMRVLKISLFVTAIYIVLLVIAGISSHSLALLSEAGHNLSDFFALLLSLVALYLQSRPPSATKTFGYHRAGVLAALINAVSLVVISFVIFYEAIRRLRVPEEIRPATMMSVAAAGVIMNGVIAWMLYRSSRDVNLRSVLLHEIGDTVSTAAVILGGWAIMATGQWWIDSALSLAIGALILWSAFGIIRETMNILLEGTPRGMDLDRIRIAICGIDGVNDVHDLHVWSIGSETHALSCHISIADIPPSVSERILRDVKERLLHDFRISHTTIQFENVVCEVAHGCVIPVAEQHQHSH